MLRAALLANPVPSKYAGGAFAACIHACRPRKRGFLFLKNSGLRSVDLNLRWKTPVKPFFHIPEACNCVNPQFKSSPCSLLRP